jgi:predicted esterase
MATFRTGTTTYPLEVPGSYVHENANPGKTLLLLTHGYADTGASFLRRTLPNLDDRFEILAPNGPFPLPQRVDGQWKEAYGWYFADISANRIFVHPQVAAGGVAGLVRKLGLEERPKILLGFSQGGYFLPHVARELKRVKRLIVIGAGFHPQFFPEFGLANTPVDAIHGDADDVIPLAEAKGDFERLPQGTRGAFHVIPGMTHVIDDNGRAALAKLLEKEK